MKKILLWFFSVGVSIFVVLLIIGFVFDDSDQSSNNTGDWISPEQKKSEVCQKIKSDEDKAYADYEKARADENKFYVDGNAAYYLSKAFADMKKYCK